MLYSLTLVSLSLNSPKHELVLLCSIIIFFPRTQSNFILPEARPISSLLLSFEFGLIIKHKKPALQPSQLESICMYALLFAEPSEAYFAKNNVYFISSKDLLSTSEVSDARKSLIKSGNSDFATPMYSH